MSRTGRKSVWMMLCALLALSTLLMIRPAPVQACSCAQPPPVQEELARKTAVFSGKVIKIEQPKQKQIKSSADPVSITFEVMTVWKGDLAQRTTVYTASSSASCGYGFAEGKEYIVFAYGTPDNLETGICERTKLLASADKELAELGAGYAPVVMADPPESPSSSWRKPLAAASLGVAAGALAVVVMLVRRRR